MILLTKKLEDLELETAALAGSNSDGGMLEDDEMSLSEYLQAVEDGTVNEYQGKQHSSVQERYEAGYALHRITKRWINTRSAARLQSQAS